MTNRGNQRKEKLKKARSEKERDKLVSNVYFNPSHKASYGGRNKLVNALKNKVPKSKIVEWLSKTDTYTLHKQARKKFPRRPYIVTGLNHLWQMDLSVFSQFSKYNGGYKYILVAIDVFSRKAYAKPLKTKAAQEVSKAIDALLKEGKNTVKYCQTDKGKEFTNSYAKEIFKKYKIVHYTYTNEEIKASLVERLQKTLKQKIYRYFTHSNSYKYVGVLQDIIKSYNNSVHSAHGKSPNSVNFQNQEMLWQKMYNPDTPKNSTPKFRIKLGDTVRISKYSSVFSKGYLPMWSNEVFVISQRHKTSPVVYSLKDESGETLDGTWYEQELQKVIVRDNVYKIERILGKRKINGQLQYLVRWLGYPPSYDSYVNKNKLLLNYKN